MKNIKYFLGIFFALALSSAIIAKSMPASKAQQQKVSLLFVQTAKTAEFKPIRRGEYQLILSNVSPRVLYFSDRPHRIAGQLSLEKFIALWTKGADSFAKDNPNAAMHYVTFEAKSKHGVHTAVFKINNPSYNKTMKTLTYNVAPLQQSFALVHATYSDPALFIDDTDEIIVSLGSTEWQ